MKVKTAELIDAALDWAVAKAKQMPLVSRGRKWPTDGAATVEYAPWAVHPVVDGSGPYVAALCHHTYSPSTDWSQGGPITDREGILCGPSPFPGNECAAGIGREWDSAKHIQTGPTPLIAAMRCFVASRLGDEVEVPDELMAQVETPNEPSPGDDQRPRARI